MIDTTHNAENGFVIRILITAPDLPQTSRWERLLIRFADPPTINKICNVASYVCNGLTLGYLIAWFFWLHGIVRHTLNPTIGQDFFLAMGWAPIMGVQLFFFAARAASLSLTAKSVEQLAQGANVSFFRGIQTCVTEAMDAYHQGREAPELSKGPTLQ